MGSGVRASVLVTSIFPRTEGLSGTAQSGYEGSIHPTILPPTSKLRSPPISKDTEELVLSSGELCQISKAISFGGSG